MRITLGVIGFASIITAAGTQAFASELVSLTDSLKPLEAAFNEDSARLRLVAILSPT